MEKDKISKINDIIKLYNLNEVTFCELIGISETDFMYFKTCNYFEDEVEKRVKEFFEIDLKENGDLIFDKEIDLKIKKRKPKIKKEKEPSMVGAILKIIILAPLTFFFFIVTVTAMGDSRGFIIAAISGILFIICQTGLRKIKFPQKIKTNFQESEKKVPKSIKKEETSNNDISQHIEKETVTKNKTNNKSSINGINIFKNANEKQKISLLREYKELLDNGVITKEEFENKKKEIL